MKTFTADLEGISPLSFSRDHREPRKESKSGAPQETPDEYEQRTWPSKLHVMPDGQIYIPPMAIKSAIEGAASYNPVKKKGSATWTKHIVQGVMIVNEVLLFGQGGDALKADVVDSETVLCFSDGKPARYSKAGKVPRTFPRIAAGWKARVEVLVLDEQIPEKVLEQHIQDAGTFVGIGRWRAEKRGLYGRFKVNKMKWSV